LFVPKRFTVMIVPDEGAKVRKLRLPRWVLNLVLSGGLLLFGVFAFLIYSHLETNFDQSELQRLRVENGQQRQNLQRLAADLDDLRQGMIFVAETEARVRQLADLDESPQAIPVAMGGMPDTDTGADINDIQKRINQLQLAIDLRRQSQENVRNLLNDQVSLGRATPRGWPTKGWLTSYFGMRKSPCTGNMAMHEGLDIAANIGTPVSVTADGIVALVEYSPTYGKTIVIDHGYGYRTLYAHNSRILVKSGQRVSRGDLISKVGNTGRSTGSHLHYEIQLNGVPIDPRKNL
jgi:septal ring factor EnvC (AmiA/AmiB activator)